MSPSEVNRSIASRAFEEIWNQGNLVAVDTLYADNFVEHGTRSDLTSGRSGFKRWISMAVASFSYQCLTVEELYAAGDKVAARYTVQGCAHGPSKRPLLGQETAMVRGAVVMRIYDGRIVESWGIAKMVELLRQCK